jgi:hypothetical protein
VERPTWDAGVADHGGDEAGGAVAGERGRPPKSYGELAGPYLKALPVGIEPGDLVNPE